MWEMILKNVKKKTGMKNSKKKQKNLLWKRRDLTIFGKITIIKSLVLPIITFTSQSTCVPPDAVKHINRIFFDFIWGKRDRIKRNIMYQDILRGGVNMLDMDAFFISIKAAWLPKILYECDTWSCIAQMHVLSIADTTSITNFHFDKENCLDKINALPTFYKDVISSYANANKYPKPVTKQQILELPLWGNKHISIYNKTTKGTTTLLFNEWTVKGIHHIRDLKFIDGKLDQAFIENIITNKRDIWRQMALMKKALKPLIPLIGDHTPQITDSNDITVTKLTVNNFYKTLTEHSDTKKYSPFQVWENIIGQSCDCKAALKQKNYNVKDFKLKEFNFKVIHRILSCEINLKKWKLQDHDKCIECGNQHSILHLLYECPNSGILWRLVEECFGYSVSP